MKTIKVREATGPVLDWLVAKCEGVRVEIENKPGWPPRMIKHFPEDPSIRGVFSPTHNWSQGGPIIGREKISVCPSSSGSAWVSHFPMLPPSKQCFSGGPTPLIAAMRCYIISKLGEEAEIPKGLT